MMNLHEIKMRKMVVQEEEGVAVADVAVGDEESSELISLEIQFYSGTQLQTSTYLLECTNVKKVKNFGKQPGHGFESCYYRDHLANAKSL